MKLYDLLQNLYSLLCISFFRWLRSRPRDVPVRRDGDAARERGLRLCDNILRVARRLHHRQDHPGLAGRALRPTPRRRPHPRRQSRRHQHASPRGHCQPHQGLGIQRRHDCRTPNRSVGWQIHNLNPHPRAFSNVVFPSNRRHIQQRIDIPQGKDQISIRKAPLTFPVYLAFIWVIN